MSTDAEKQRAYRGGMKRVYDGGTVQPGISSITMPDDQRASDRQGAHDAKVDQMKTDAANKSAKENKSS